MSKSLLRTPLYPLHETMGAKFVPFAGYEMPVQYALGVKKEHLHTRTAAGLFDVSHMGQVKITGPNAKQTFERLVPVDIQDLPVGKQRYAFFTNDQGGILDDLMVTNFGDHLFIVVNAACKHQDIQLMQDNLDADVEVLAERALIALQGPKACEVLARFCPAVAELKFMDAIQIVIDGVECIISRSGYTGEDGYELSLPNTVAQTFCERLLAESEVELIGLGARDSLRLEAGLCLYGHDLDPSTTPVEASLVWAISPVRRISGDRAGGFPGADIILQQLASKQVSRKRVGLVGLSKAPVREGAELFDTENNHVGIVTSGGFGPSVDMPVVMAYVAPSVSEVGTELFASVRGKLIPLVVSNMPFVKPSYYRG